MDRGHKQAPVDFWSQIWDIGPRFFVFEILITPEKPNIQSN